MKIRCYLILALTGVVFCLNCVTAADTPLAFDASLPGAPAPQVRPPSPGPIPVAQPPPVHPPVHAGPLPAGILAFDSESKDYTMKSGEIVAAFVFILTNVYSDEVIITFVQDSCGCSAVQVPPLPW